MPEKISPIRKARFFVHCERPADAALGVRTVEFLMVAYNKDAPLEWREVAIYRPLDPEAHVYKVKGGWDFRPVSEFFQRYRPVTSDEEIGQLEVRSATMYDPATWVKFRLSDILPTNN
jgi:hypothetical protein